VQSPTEMRRSKVSILINIRYIVGKLPPNKKGGPLSHQKPKHRACLRNETDELLEWAFKIWTFA